MVKIKFSKWNFLKYPLSASHKVAGWMKNQKLQIVMDLCFLIYGALCKSFVRATVDERPKEDSESSLSWRTSRVTSGNKFSTNILFWKPSFSFGIIFWQFLWKPWVYSSVLSHFVQKVGQLVHRMLKHWVGELSHCKVRNMLISILAHCENKAEILYLTSNRRTQIRRPESMYWTSDRPEL